MARKTAGSQRVKFPKLSSFKKGKAFPGQTPPAGKLKVKVPMGMPAVPVVPKLPT